MHAVVIGCGRVGSFVARDLADDGWSVESVIDEAAASRSTACRPASRASGFEPGHALDQEGHAHRRDRPRRRMRGRDRAATTRTSSSPSSPDPQVQRRLRGHARCSTLCARTCYRAAWGLNNRPRPTKAAIDELTNGTNVRAPARGGRALMVHPDRRRRQDRPPTSTKTARADGRRGHRDRETTPAATRCSRRTSSTSRSTATPPRSACSSAAASAARASSPPSRGRRGQRIVCQLVARPLRRHEDDRAGQRPA